MRSIVRYIVSILTLFAYTGCANSIGVAVKRGQKVVEASSLPLVCICIETYRAALPLDKIVFEDLDRGTVIKAVVAKSLNPSRPDMLTANADGNRSLSMPILHLPPGRYVIKSLEFVGPQSGVAGTSFEFDVSTTRQYIFRVQEGCVNYVGSLVITADWETIRLPYISANAVNPTQASQQFASRVSTEQSAVRDARWATDVVPGMQDLKAVFSMIETR